MEKRLGCEYEACGVAFIAAPQESVDLVSVLVTFLAATQQKPIFCHRLTGCFKQSVQGSI